MSPSGRHSVPPNHLVISCWSAIPTCEGSGTSFSLSSQTVLPAFLAFPHRRRQRNVLLIVFANSFAGFSRFSPPAKAAERPSHRLRKQFCRLFSLFPTCEDSGTSFSSSSHAVLPAFLAFPHLRRQRSALLIVFARARWRRSDFSATTCATAERILVICGAGLPLFFGPAPRDPGTCAKKAGNLRHEGLEPALRGPGTCATRPCNYVSTARDGSCKTSALLRPSHATQRAPPISVRQIVPL